MELSQHGFLEELLSPTRRESLSNSTTSFSSGLMSSDQFFPNSWAFDAFEENPVLAISSSSTNPSPFVGFSTLLQIDQADNSEPCPFTTTHDQASHDNYPFVVDHHGVLSDITDTTPFPSQEAYPTNIAEDDQEFGFNLGSDCFEEGNHNKSSTNSTNDCCKVEMLDQQQSCSEVVVVPSFNMGVCGEVKRGIRPKKLEGQPSKNLMAERRRRKRLNDRLSMLRSIVPKISKMDRTSILGDTIDYMKELLERISKLQKEGTNEKVKLLGISREIKPNEVLVRNTPKFDVERRETDTRIDISCAAKPGLLISTVNTLEALGLEIQHCVISCFNDFSMQASCSEVAEQRSSVSSEDIKQEIFRNAGYGGRCL